MNHEAAIVVFLALIAFIPILRNRNSRTLRIFAVFAWASLVSALVAFGFMIAMWSIVEEKFKAAGWKVRWGPLVGVYKHFFCCCVCLVENSSFGSHGYRLSLYYHS